MYIEDILRLHAIIIEENPGVKVFLVGQSLGGLIALLSALSYPDLFGAAVLIAPSIFHRLKFSFIDYIDMVLFSKILC